MNATTSELSIENKKNENDGTLGQFHSGRELQIAVNNQKWVQKGGKYGHKR